MIEVTRFELGLVPAQENPCAEFGEATSNIPEILSGNNLTERTFVTCNIRSRLPGQNYVLPLPRQVPVLNLLEYSFLKIVSGNNFT